MAVGDVYTTKKGNDKIVLETTGCFHIADFGPSQQYGWQHRANGRRRYVVWHRGEWKAEPKPSWAE